MVTKNNTITKEILIHFTTIFTTERLGWRCGFRSYTFLFAGKTATCKPPFKKLASFRPGQESYAPLARGGECLPMDRLARDEFGNFIPTTQIHRTYVNHREVVLVPNNQTVAVPIAQPAGARVSSAQMDALRKADYRKCEVNLRISKTTNKQSCSFLKTKNWLLTYLLSN
jgi:hypothetical protein